MFILYLFRPFVLIQYYWIKPVKFSLLHPTRTKLLPLYPKPLKHQALELELLSAPIGTEPGLKPVIIQHVCATENQFWGLTFSIGHQLPWSEDGFQQIFKYYDAIERTFWWLFGDIFIDFIEDFYEVLTSFWKMIVTVLENRIILDSNVYFSVCRVCSIFTRMFTSRPRKGT